MRLTSRRRYASLIAVVVLAACGGGSDPIADYIASTALITEQMTRDAFAALPPGAAPTRQQVTDVVEVRRTALAAISALQAPTEMTPEHQALTLAMGRFVEAGEEFLAETATLDPPGFLAALEASTDIDAIADEVGVACAAWERRAADLGTPVELGC